MDLKEVHSTSKLDRYFWVVDAASRMITLSASSGKINLMISKHLNYYGFIDDSLPGNLVTATSSDSNLPLTQLERSAIIFG